MADPVTLLQEYVGRHDSIHNAHLALFLREDGSHPTWSWFDARFFAILNQEFGTHPVQVVPHSMQALVCLKI